MAALFRPINKQKLVLCLFIARSYFFCASEECTVHVLIFSAKTRRESQRETSETASSETAYDLSIESNCFCSTDIISSSSSGVVMLRNLFAREEGLMTFDSSPESKAFTEELALQGFSDTRVQREVSIKRNWVSKWPRLITYTLCWGLG